MRRTVRWGMSLVELLVVVAIIGMLVTILLPAVQSAREAARRAQCQNQLRQVGIALHVYHEANGQLPVGCIDKRTSRNAGGRQLAWSASLLPHLEEPALWSRIEFAAAYDSDINAAAASSVVPLYLCPSTVRTAHGRDGAMVIDPSSSSEDRYRAAAIDYGGIFGAAQTSPSINGVLIYNRAVKLKQVTDGTAHTLAVAEDTGRGWPMNGEWINGENIFDVGGVINQQQDNEIWSDHPGIAMAAWCDGRATPLADSIEPIVLRALCTRAGRESISPTP